jgi:hypothetical protein
VLSVLAEASSFPSGLKATPLTSDVCSWSVRMAWPFETSHSLMLLSTLAEASSFPSGLKASDVIKL